MKDLIEALNRAHKLDESLNEAKISDKEVMEIFRDANHSAKEFGLSDEFTLEYYIGAEVSAAGYPLDCLYRFLPDHIGTDDKEYQDAARGWKENLGLDPDDTQHNGAYGKYTGDEDTYEALDRAHELDEAAFSGGMAGDNSFSGGTIRGCGGSTQPKKNTYLSRIKSKNPELVDTMILKGSDIKPNMITQYGQVKTAEVKYSDHYGKKMLYLMHTNNYDGFFEPDKEMEVMVDPDDKSKPFTGDYHDLLKKGLQESASSVI